MPETRYHSIYKNGKEIERIAYVVSDERLLQERAFARLRTITSDIRQVATALRPLAEQTTNPTLAQMKSLVAHTAQLTELLFDLARVIELQVFGTSEELSQE